MSLRLLSHAQLGLRSCFPTVGVARGQRVELGSPRDRTRRVLPSDLLPCTSGSRVDVWVGLRTGETPRVSYPSTPTRKGPYVSVQYKPVQWYNNSVVNAARGDVDTTGWTESAGPVSHGGGTSFGSARSGLDVCVVRPPETSRGALTHTSSDPKPHVLEHLGRTLERRTSGLEKTRIDGSPQFFSLTLRAFRPDRSR